MTAEPHLPRQVRMQLPGEDDPRFAVGIDEHLAPLMALMWAHGFTTGMSCEGGRIIDDGPSLAYVTLFDTEDAGRGFAVLATGRADPPGWRFDGDDEAVVVAFPPDDLPAITTRVREATSTGGSTGER